MKFLHNCQNLFLLVAMSCLFVSGSALRQENFNRDEPQEIPKNRYEFQEIQPSAFEQIAGDAIPGSSAESSSFNFPHNIPRNPVTDRRSSWPWNFDKIRQENSRSGQVTGRPPIQGSIITLDNWGRIKMGNQKDCDDGASYLETDWNGSPVNHTCFHPESPYPEDTEIPPVVECINLPKEYLPKHHCMNETIIYDHPIPTYGDHRPVWPTFGEYKFVPVQRWLHSIEHGAVVMLYHPCTHPEEVNHLRRILRTCYGKHVITPSTLLPKERPLALVAWGCRYLMASVDEVKVIKFIKEKSMKGPEGTFTKEGKYEFGLVRTANETIGSRYDQITCELPRRN